MRFLPGWRKRGRRASLRRKEGRAYLAQKMERGDEGRKRRSNLITGERRNAVCPSKKSKKLESPHQRVGVRKKERPPSPPAER